MTWDGAISFCTFCVGASHGALLLHHGHRREGYGFVYIDADNDFRRIKKDSFYWYQKAIASNGEDLD